MTSLNIILIYRRRHSAERKLVDLARDKSPNVILLYHPSPSYVIVDELARDKLCNSILPVQ